MPKTEPVSQVVTMVVRCPAIIWAEVDEAARRLGLRVRPGPYYDPRTRCACPLGVLTVAMDRPEFWARPGLSGRDVQGFLGLTYSGVCGFSDGYNGRPVIGRSNVDREEYLTRYWQGADLRRAQQLTQDEPACAGR